MMVKPNGTVKHSTAHYGRGERSLYTMDGPFYGEGHFWKDGDVALWRNFESNKLKTALYVNYAWTYPSEITDVALSLGISEYSEANALLLSDRLMRIYAPVVEPKHEIPPWFEPVDPDKVVNFGVF